MNIVNELERKQSVCNTINHIENSIQNLSYDFIGKQSNEENARHLVNSIEKILSEIYVDNPMDFGISYELNDGVISVNIHD